MRAVQVTRFGGPEVLALVDVPRPTPISTELLVEVRAAGVNPVDWKTRNGSGVAAWMGPPPFTLGWDVAGVVADMGFGVTTFEPGDRVFGMPWFPREAGAYAEYVAAPSRQFARIPDRMSFEEAAALPLAALTAWQSLVDTAGVQPRQRVLVHGASGGVGHLAVQIAKARGAFVIGTGRAANHDFMRELGVDECLDRDELPSDVDVAMDLVGGREDALLGTVREGGILVEVAGDVDDVRPGVRAVEPLVEPDGHALREIARLGIRSVVHEVLPLEEAAKAHELLEAGGLRGKIVLST